MSPHAIVFAQYARPYLGPCVWNMSRQEADSAYDLLVAGWNFGLTPSSVPLQIRRDAERWPPLQSMIRRKHSKFADHRWRIEDHTVGRDGGGYRGSRCSPPMVSQTVRPMPPLQRMLDVAWRPGPASPAFLRWHVLRTRRPRSLRYVFPTVIHR